MKRNRWVILLTGTLLGVGALSGCERGEAGATDKVTVPHSDAADIDAEGDVDGDADADADDGEDLDFESDDFDDADHSGDGASNLDGGVTDDSDGAGGDDSRPNPGVADPDSADDDQLSVLPTTYCPIDIPEPFAPHNVDHEERGDGIEVHCVVHVSSKGDPVYLEQGIIEQFSALNAEKVEGVTAADPYDPNDITIHSWNYNGYEIIVNMSSAGASGVDLVYVVREIR